MTSSVIKETLLPTGVDLPTALAEAADPSSLQTSLENACTTSSVTPNGPYSEAYATKYANTQYPPS